MSGGEQQMLAIGRCLMGQPELIMFDEPSLGLAPALVQELFKTIRALTSAGSRCILVEQNVAVSLKLANRAYVLENGRIVADRAPATHCCTMTASGRPISASRRPSPHPSGEPMSKPPFKEIEFAPPLVERVELPGGAFLLRSPVPLDKYEPSLAHILRRQAARSRTRTFSPSAQPMAAGGNSPTRVHPHRRTRSRRP